MLCEFQVYNKLSLLYMYPLFFTFSSPYRPVQSIESSSLWCTSAAAKSLQSCPILRDPIDGSPPGSPVPGILQARTLEWVAISFSNAWKWKVKVKSFSRVWLLATPWTAAYQAPPSVGFSRQEYWSGVPSPSPTLMYSRSLLVVYFIYSCEERRLFKWEHRFPIRPCLLTTAVHSIP